MVLTCLREFCPFKRNEFDGRVLKSLFARGYICMMADEEFVCITEQGENVISEIPGLIISEKAIDFIKIDFKIEDGKCLLS